MAATPAEVAGEVVASGGGELEEKQAWPTCNR